MNEIEQRENRELERNQEVPIPIIGCVSGAVVGWKQESCLTDGTRFYRRKFIDDVEGNESWSDWRLQIPRDCE